MRDAIAATGRAMVYIISEYGMQAPWTWADSIANSWRTTSDIQPHWASISDIIAAQAPLAQYAHPGAWNDPDMLQVGNGDLTPDETRTHIAMWAMLASPLMIGTDIKSLPAETLNALLNKDLVAIDQDPLGDQASLIATVGDAKLWTRTLAVNRQAAAIQNTRNSSVNIRLHVSGCDGLTDVWTGKDMPVDNGILTVSVPAHGTALYIRRNCNGQPGVTMA